MIGIINGVLGIIFVVIAIITIMFCLAVSYVVLFQRELVKEIQEELVKEMDGK